MKQLTCDLCGKRISKREYDDELVCSSDHYENICWDCQRNKRYKVKIVITGGWGASKADFDYKLGKEMYCGWIPDGCLDWKLTEIRKKK